MAQGTLTKPAPQNPERTLHEVVELTQDCELGEKGERAVVIHLAFDGYWYMTLLFPNRALKHARKASTGADYRYLKGV